jgi:hypothetical protein
VESGSVLAGREELYAVPPQPVRVLSLVPRHAADIRDAAPGSFGDVEDRLSRANLLLVGSSVALAGAALLGLVLVVRAVPAWRPARTAARRSLPASRVIRAASRELAAVERAVRREGWGPASAGRAAAALRLAGAIALGRPVGHRTLDRGSAHEGEVVSATRWRRRRLALSAAVTPATSPGRGAPAWRRGAWEEVRAALAALDEVRYGRSDDRYGAELDEALARARSALRRFTFRLGWRRVHGASPPAAEATTPSWAR